MSKGKVIDLPAFEALRESVGSDFIVELLDAYYQETPQLLADLQKALAAKDSDAFRRAAHSIKSTSNTFGALEFGSLAKELEMMGRDNKLDGAADKVARLNNEYAVVRKELAELTHAK
jgi:histidine phosphotransfer protein HptB